MRRCENCNRPVTLMFVEPCKPGMMHRFKLPAFWIARLEAAGRAANTARPDATGHQRQRMENE